MTELLALYLGGFVGLTMAGKHQNRDLPWSAAIVGGIIWPVMVVLMILDMAGFDVESKFGC